MKKALVLCILDGWGEGVASPANALSCASTPCWDALTQRFDKSLLSASGEDVGLPERQMGNSEVGHMTIGAGRAILQDLPRIDHAIKKGELARNQTLLTFAHDLKTANKACHLMGLLSPGGVHSHVNHMVALCEILNAQGVTTHVHGLLDGRDTPPQSALGFVDEFLTRIQNLSHVTVSTLGGRYYAMDRDNRWERIDKAYEAMVQGKSMTFEDPLSYIKESYHNNTNDEFVLPGCARGYGGVQQGDGVLVANFRADRVRQILGKLVEDPAFATSSFVGMTRYSRELDQRFQTLFPPQFHDQTLGEVISQQGMTQLRLAETEKYAHVTYFLNGGQEDPFGGEDRIMIPSPKVATYDLQPEMSASEVTDKICEAVSSGVYDLVVVNYANADMVGHTGDLAAAIKAVESLDHCLERVWACVEKVGGVLALTADHGNVEAMVDPASGKTHTAHTLNPVPFVLCGPSRVPLKSTGTLADIAPTVLDVLKIEKPAQMTGHSLLKE